MQKISFADGVYDVSNSEYHASSALSRSALMKFNITPYHYWYEYLSGQYISPEPSADFILGDLVHTMVLESHLYESKFVLSPSVDRHTTGGKAIYSKFIVEKGDRIVITDQQLLVANQIHNKIQQDEQIKKIIDGALVEKSIFFTHQSTGIQCKARPDIWSGSLCADLKTTKNASFREFQSSAYRYGYYLQAGMIREALRSIDVDMTHFVFICAEKEPPYAQAIYLLEEEAIQFGVDSFNALMDSFARCLEKSQWPSYGIKSLSVPNYARISDPLEFEY